MIQYVLNSTYCIYFLLTLINNIHILLICRHIFICIKKNKEDKDVQEDIN